MRSLTHEWETLEDQKCLWFWLCLNSITTKLDSLQVKVLEVLGILPIKHSLEMSV